MFAATVHAISEDILAEMIDDEKFHSYLSQAIRSHAPCEVTEDEVEEIVSHAISRLIPVCA